MRRAMSEKLAACRILLEAEAGVLSRASLQTIIGRNLLSCALRILMSRAMSLEKLAARRILLEADLDASCNYVQLAHMFLQASDHCILSNLSG